MAPVKAEPGNKQVLSAAPQGKEKLKWLGPGFLWMVSAAGSGELLFTPRVGSLYGYALVCALFAAVIMKWFTNREVGRYTVCAGATVLDGFSNIPGPCNWKPVGLLKAKEQLKPAISRFSPY